jgi:hypothetical protein
MDKSTANALLQEILREHPELLEATESKPLSPEERKTISTTVRTTQAVSNRIDALAEKLQGTALIDYKGNQLNRSDVIRAALEKGVTELEKLIE